MGQVELPDVDNASESAFGLNIGLGSLTLGCGVHMDDHFLGIEAEEVFDFDGMFAKTDVRATMMVLPEESALG